jgi:hypothetical protein
VFTIFWSKEVYVGLIEKRESLTSDEKKPGWIYMWRRWDCVWCCYGNIEPFRKNWREKTIFKKKAN